MLVEYNRKLISLYWYGYLNFDKGIKNILDKIFLINGIEIIECKYIELWY